MKNKRVLSIELLRVFCIVGIITMHILAKLISHQEYFVLSIIENSLFNSCVSIFILISGYFSIKFNIRRIAKYYFMLLFISWLHLLIRIVVNAALGNSNYSIESIRQLMSLVFPLITSNRWFFSCYFLLYFISPIINYTINEYLKNNRLIFNLLLILLILFIYVAPTFLLNGIAYNYGGKEFITILFLYLFGRYIYIYTFFFSSIKINFGFWLITYAIIVIGNFLSIKLFNKVLFARDNSLFILMQAYFIFSIFINLNLNYSFISRISKYVFSIFLYQPIFTETLFPLISYSFMVDKPFYSQIIIVVLYVLLTMLFAIITENIRLRLLGRIENMFVISCESIYTKFNFFDN